MGRFSLAHSPPFSASHAHTFGGVYVVVMGVILYNLLNLNKIFCVEFNINKSSNLYGYFSSALEMRKDCKAYAKKLCIILIIAAQLKVHTLVRPD